MNHYLLIKQKNLNTLEESKLCECICDIEQTQDKISFTYAEEGLEGRVHVVFHESECFIERHAVITTHLHFIENRRTSGFVESEYGAFVLEIFTHKYKKWNEVIALEYDILSGEEITDSFRLMFRIKKLA